MEHCTSNITGSFNPRVREGRDPRAHMYDRQSLPFQSTRPRGTRPRACRGAQARQVSIHASARDATGRRGSLPAETLFQSTRPRGTRRSSSSHIASAFMFQSTRPRGTRRARRFCSLWQARFNPRVREGRDFRPARLSDNHAVSIHASARDATAYRQAFD